MSAFDQFAAAAYRGFYFDSVRPFDDLPDDKKQTWRRVAAAVLAAEHNTVVVERLPVHGPVDHTDRPPFRADPTGRQGKYG